ncbi:MAG: hypothetical protein DRP87_12680, partial [Spirochaetes bacterium]
EYPEDTTEDNNEKFKFNIGKYTGNKWSGKYLRAPDIFFIILGKEKDKLLSIEPNIGKVITVSWSRKGINSKILFPKEENNSTQHEKIPVLKSPREIQKIIFNKGDTESLLLLINEIKNELKHAKLLWVDIRGDRHICHYNIDNLYFTHNFHGIIPYDDSLIILLCGLLNSTLTSFFVEVLGRKGLGGGAVRLLIEDLRRADILVAPALLEKEQKNKIEKLIKKKFGKRRIKSIFQELGINPRQPIRSQKPNLLPYRPSACRNLHAELQGRHGAQADKALDDIVFDVLGLTQAERDEVYWSVCELVKNRLEKARSV